MPITVKTLSGDLLHLSCPLGTTHSDLPFLIRDALGPNHELSSPEKLHHLQVIPEESDHRGLVEDGQVFYLLVEDPQIRVSMQQFMLSVTQVASDEMGEVHTQVLDHFVIYVTHVKAGEEECIYEFDFYTPIVDIVTSEGISKRYSNVYYRKDDIKIIYRFPEDERLEIGYYAVVDILPGTTAHYHPNVFASDCPIPSYQLAIQKEIDRVWREHVRSTGEPDLVPIQNLYPS